MLWKRRQILQDRRTGALARMYEASGAGRYGMPAAEFEQLLQEVETKCLRKRDSTALPAEFFDSLHLKELVLARACARGNEIAWNDFVSSYRPTIVSAARQLCRNASEAEEMAGSLYAELFGLKEREGERISLLDSYLGTGSLAGWLRMILAQREVEQWRRRRRLVAWEDEHLEPVDVHASEQMTDGLQPVSALEEAVTASLRRLPDESRLLLTLYYLDERSLAEIGKFLGVHESTVSRRLNRLLQETRGLVLEELRQRGLNGPAAEEALHTDVRRLTLDLRTYLASTGRPPQRAGAMAPLSARFWGAARAASPRPRQTVGDPT